MPIEQFAAIHATAVAIGDDGLLIRGASRSGKSHLALALIAESAAILVGDDRILLSSDGDELMASPHPRIAGLIERRGHGILAMPFRAAVPLVGIVDLGRPGSDDGASSPVCAPAATCILAGKNFPSLFIVNQGRWDARCAQVLAWFSATSAAHRRQKLGRRTSNRSKD